MGFQKRINLLILPIVILTSTALSAGTLKVADQDKFEALVQHYCYFSENLFIRIRKLKNNTLYLSDTNKRTIEYAQERFNKELDDIRTKFFNDQQEEAIKQFTNHILGLVTKFNLKQYYLFGFQSEVDDESIEEQLDLITSANKALEAYYEKIKPYPPVLKQLENALLYNFVSTKVIPKIVSLSGPALSAWWLSRKIFQGAKNPFSLIRKYVEIPHNSIRKGAAPTFFGIPLEERDFNGKDFTNRFTVLMKGLYEASRSNDYCPCQNAKEHGHVCKASDGKCYQDVGYETNIAKLLAKGTPKFDFALPFFAMRYLGQTMEEYQLPEYKRRIEKHNQEIDQKKVEQEMRNLKVQYEKEVGFDFIKGQKTLIDNEIRMIVDYLKHPFKYKRETGSLSLLFYGPPGNGKTLLARSIAKESGAPYLEINADDVLHPDSKEKILAVWRMAEKVAAERPEKSAIIYLDEIDNVVGNRKNGQLDPVRAKALANLLSILDGIEKRNPYLHVVIIICTNHHKNLDPALMRPGRIDHKICITVPDERGRQEFFDALIPEENRNLIPELNKRTAGLSGAEIQNMISNASMIASYHGRRIPIHADYTRALDNMLRQKEETA